jgi:nucleotide-binding universal stress UspA family protein
VLDFGSAFFIRRERHPEAPDVSGEPGAAPLRVLALLPEAETVASCLQCARAVVAGVPKAKIDAVHVGFDPEHTIVSAEELGIQLLRESWEGSAASRLARTRAAFDDWLAGDPQPPVTWRVHPREVDLAVIAEAEQADLLVIGRPIHLDGRDALFTALFHTRRPVLLAPPDPSPVERTFGRHLVVGWKPTDQAERAVTAAAPWLKRAEKVTVVCIAKPGTPPYAASAARLFDRLGIACDIETKARDGRSVGGQLLAEVRRLGGDGLVIGAFRHGPMWEAILGGVTRDVLATMDVPVFTMR